MGGENKSVERGKTLLKEALSYYRAMMDVLLSDRKSGFLDYEQFKTQAILLGRQLKAAKDIHTEMPDSLQFCDTELGEFNPFDMAGGLYQRIQVGEKAISEVIAARDNLAAALNPEAAAAEAQARFHAQIQDKWSQPKSASNPRMPRWTDALFRGYWPNSCD